MAGHAGRDWLRFSTAEQDTALDSACEDCSKLLRPHQCTLPDLAEVCLFCLDTFAAYGLHGPWIDRAGEATSEQRGTYMTSPHHRAQPTGLRAVIGITEPEASPVTRLLSLVFMSMHVASVEPRSLFQALPDPVSSYCMTNLSSKDRR